RRVARAAVGGGTPTLLEPDQLERLFRLLHRFEVEGPACVETSPSTATPDRLRVLQRHGVHRVSLGVQSFLEEETRALGRPQDPATLDCALRNLQRCGFPSLNLDLIYGIPGQTAATWERSLREALAWQPQELYLYPLYVRPLTGLDRRPPGPDWDRQRLELYRRGRDLLLSSGYRQLSMRHFSTTAQEDFGCQDDPMLGLGAGARSYTRRLHYSSEYAVSRAGVRAIVERFLTQDHQTARHGVWLSQDEQRRRWAIKTLLQVRGLDREAYMERFGADVLEHLPGLCELDGLLRREGRFLRLTDEGLERSDALGPWLYSRESRQRMEAYAWS
ncbi:MAG: STM4012 family radical SAM protein, partial [Candidatus Eremiobacterota bacterium]